MPVLSCRQHLMSDASKLMTCAALLFYTLAGNAFAHGVTFKLQHVQPQDSALTKQFLEPWAQKIHDESGGRISLLVSPRDDTQAEADLFQVTLDRTADIVWLDLPEPAAAFPKFSVFGMALEGATSEGSSQALWSWIDTNDLAFREFKELRILAASRHDAPAFHMRDRSVTSLSDLKGAKIAIPNSSAQAFLTALGASPVIAPKSDLQNALTEKSVDGVLLSWNSLATLKLEDLVKVHAEAPAGAPWPYAELSVLLMNPDAYRSLADDLKQVTRANSGSDTSAWIGKVLDKSASEARKRAASSGHSINRLPESELSAWHEAAKAATSARVKEFDARGIMVEKMITRARALVMEYDKAN